MRYFFFCIVIMSGILSKGLIAQDFSEHRVPFTAVSFLLTDVQPRTIGLSGINVVGITNTFSRSYTSNPSLSAGYDDGVRFSLNYNPYSIREGNPALDNYKISKEIFNLASHLQFNFKNKNAIGYDFRYFNYGEVIISNVFGDNIQTYKPKDFALKVFYSRLFKNVRLGIASAYIRSDLFKDGFEKYLVNTVAFDIGFDGFTTKHFKGSSSSYTLNYGVSFQNLGPNFKYAETEPINSILPSILKVGLSNVFQIQPKESSKFLTRVYIGYQADKLLAPTPSSEDNDNNGIFDFLERKWAGQVFGSFADAPDGFKEEMKEINHHIGGGVELIFDNEVMFALNSGIFLENKYKGNRKNVSLSPVIGIKGFNIEYTYTFSLNETGPLNSVHQFGINLQVAKIAPKLGYNNWTNPTKDKQLIKDDTEEADKLFKL
ncbi:MAG: PorV/PorQ family protein [Chitinophagales bacterium]